MVRRVSVTVVGTVVLLVGLAMLVLPGPGLLGTAAGLAILASEYDWARHHLHHVRERAHHVSQLAGASPRNVALSLVGAAAMLAMGVAALVVPGLLPTGQTAAGVSLVVGGLLVAVGTLLGYRERRHALRQRRRAGEGESELSRR